MLNSVLPNWCAGEEDDKSDGRVDEMQREMHGVVMTRLAAEADMIWRAPKVAQNWTDRQPGKMKMKELAKAGADSDVIDKAWSLDVLSSHLHPLIFWYKI